MQVNLCFTPGPKPATGFHRLNVTAKDAGGAEQKQAFSQTQLTAQAVAQPDGSYLLPIVFSPLAVGTCHLTAQCSYLDANNFERAFGPVAAADMEVPLSEGAWVPVPVSFNFG
jgi:hypothetical protein